MKKRFLCLMLTLLMIVPVCLLSSCNNKSDKSDIAEEASETTNTLTMFMITEKHVPTSEEVAELLASKGATNMEYLEAKGTMESYAAVAAALDKITKAKFRIHLITTFYTIEEYRAVEEFMDFQAKAAVMKKEAKDEYNKYKKAQKALGISDEAEIKRMFYSEHPDYAAYTDAETAAETVITEAETIINEYGIEELKYPDADFNQVDIICVCGYDKYIEYVNNGWLNDAVDAELDSSSKAIKTYVNEKFLTTATVNNKIYAIPNNMAIGEYTYLLLNKGLVSQNGYDLDTMTSLWSKDVQDFLKDIQNYQMENGWTPITGDIGLTNTFFWSLDYEYTAVEKDSIKTVADMSDDILYYIRSAVSESDNYKYHRITKAPAIEDATYATATATAFAKTAFDTGKTYYVSDGEGGYVATTDAAPVEGTKYFTVAFKDVDFEEGDTFAEGTVYYIKDGNGYTRIYTFKTGAEYFTVNSVSFAPDKFSVLGNVFSAQATKDTQVTTSLFKSSALNSYKSQKLSLQSFIDNGYYDKTAMNDTNKKFAAAVIKGGANLAETYGEDYHMVVLEYPRANIEDICHNMFSVSSATKSLKSSMEIITYLNTNSDFRNLLQYGIEGSNYNLVNITDEETGKIYPTVERINDYYMMDIYKTGNVFIAYPEENMVYNEWDYGKKQNADAQYHPMIDFDVNQYVNQIDFSVVDSIAELSEKYEEMINNASTQEELASVFTTIESELNKNKMYQRELVGGVLDKAGTNSSNLDTYNAYSLYHAYCHWWYPLYYVEMN